MSVVLWTVQGSIEVSHALCTLNLYLDPRAWAAEAAKALASNARRSKLRQARSYGSVPRGTRHLSSAKKKLASNHDNTKEATRELHVHKLWQEMVEKHS